MASPQLDLALPQDVLTYLSDGPFASADAMPLSGGFGNYVYRIHLSQEYRGKRTLVLKHGKPYIPGATWMAFGLERQKYDSEAMRRVKALLPDDSLVTVPEVHLFDETANVIIMDDCGEDSVTLKSLLQSGAPLAPASFRKLGAGLGAFLARLHAWGVNDEELLEFFEGNKQARTLSAWATYGRLVSTLSGEHDTLADINDPPLDLDRDTLDRIAKIAQEKTNVIKTTRETVVMGDFWPGNVLLSLTHKSENREEVEVEKVYVVDWELVKPGLRGMDIGQFCGEMYQMKHFFPATELRVTELVSEFLETYRTESKSVRSDEVAGVALTHIGAHLVAWTPRGTWHGKATIREVVMEGVQHLLDGSEGDPECIDRSFVGGLSVGTRRDE